MSHNKFLKCACAHCSGHIEYPADGIGSTIACPHCGRETELTLETPVGLTSEKLHTSKWAVAGLIILGIGFLGVIAALLLAPRMMEKARFTQPVTATAPLMPSPPAKQIINEFSMANVAIERTPSSTLVYGGGVLKNETDRQRFGVSVELDLLDARGTRIGTAKDYAPIIEPRAEWKFRALLLTDKAASLRIADVKEQP